MRGRFQRSNKMPAEVELDLAPMLAVMVKLVPVLLLSSAFAQVMIIESDLPQAVKEAMAQPQDPSKTTISLEVDRKQARFVVKENGVGRFEVVPNLADGKLDYSSIHAKLVELKTAHPDVFRLELNPDGSLSYQEVVKVMDEARKVRSKDTLFPVFDSRQQKDVLTPFMFPDVVLSNLMEG